MTLADILRQAKVELEADKQSMPILRRTRRELITQTMDVIDKAIETEEAQRNELGKYVRAELKKLQKGGRCGGHCSDEEQLIVKIIHMAEGTMAIPTELEGSKAESEMTTDRTLANMSKAEIESEIGWLEAPYNHPANLAQIDALKRELEAREGAKEK